MGLHLGTCSFDRTWRLWDLTTEKCLLEQEGHSRPVYCLAFQCDGSLAVSGGLDGYARVWDLRTGRSLTLLKGHAKSILAVDFSSNGYMIATGSEDHTCRVYDLRKKETLAVLPGHRSLISQVRFDKNGQNCLLTSGYDNVSKIWCGRRLKLVKTLAGHDGKVMGSDISNHFYKIATVGYDRTIKLWHPDLHE
jgi:U4/U6 small nuclear ribonucleoprotein PRP4